VLNRPQRPPPKPPPSELRRRHYRQRPPSPAARWQRDWRRRVAEGSVLTEVPAAMVELLIAGKWLQADEATDKRAITEALCGMAKASLKNFR
jgi:hypothetical protein